MKADPYKTLGVPKNATKDEIKRAHRRKVVKSHPDKGGTPEQFHAVQLAYEILGDDARRARFDETGEAPDERHNRNKAMSELVKMAIGLAEEMPEDTTDMIRAMRQIVAKIQQRNAQNKEKATARAKKLRKAANRYSCKDGPNVFAQVLETEAAKSEAVCQEIARDVEAAEEMTKILDGFSYQTDERPEQKSFYAPSIADMMREASGYAQWK